MARSKRGIWFKFGRFITGITVACFFLPFFGVSCGGMDVITVSGADMVGGCQPGGLIADNVPEQKTVEIGEDGRATSRTSDTKLDNVDREPLAIAALVLALAVFGLSWVRTRGALIGALVLSLGCLGALGGLYVKVGGQLDEEVNKELTKKDASGVGEEIMKDAEIDAGSRWGLWFTCAGLLAVAGITGLALREPEGAELAPPTPPPAG